MIRRFSEYKRSEEDWIGEIPNHWDCIKLKYLSNDATRVTVSQKELEGKEVIHYSIPNVQAFGIGQLENGSEIDSSKLLVQEGEVLFSKLNPRKGTVCIVQEHGNRLIVSSGEFVPVVPFRSNNSYIYYTLGSKLFIDYVDSQVESVTRSHQRVRPDVILGSYIPHPPIKEQDEIVSFLDIKTEKIDSLVAITEKKIELLNEKRISLINRVVSKGLNSDFNLKPLNLGWVDTIPEHWEIGQIRRFTSEHRQGYYSTDGYSQMGHRVVRITDIKDDNVIDVSDSPFYEITEEDRDRFELRDGDFLFQRTGAHKKIGVFHSNEPSIYASFLIRFRFQDRINHEYLRYYFNSSLYTSQLNQQIHGGVNPNIHAENIKVCYTTIPPIKEQEEIVNYLDKKTEEIDRLVSIEEKRIETLKEYRQSLISEVVTGKVKVTNTNP